MQNKGTGFILFLKLIMSFFIFYFFNYPLLLREIKCIKINGDWGLGIGDWGLGGWAQTPKPKTQNPKPKTQKKNFFLKKKKKI